jgi:N-acetylated-alpha-linked acidic dipeptidase
MKKLLSLLLLVTTISQVNAQTGFIGGSAATQSKAEETFLKQQESERYKNHLKNLTKEPHISGSKANERVRD